MGIVDLGKVRGTQTYTGNKITGSNANATVFPETGIAKAYEGDLYINTDVLSEFKGNVYECTVAGEPDAAKWIFKGSIRGPKVDTVNNLKSTSTEDALSAYQGKRLLDMMKEAGVFSRKVVVDYDGTVFGAKLTIDNVNSTFSFLINGREYKYTYEAAGKAETTTLSVSLGTNLGMEANGGILTEIRSSAANIYYYVLTDNTSAGVYSKTVDIWESVNDNKQSHEITGTIVDGDETFYDGPIKKVVNGIKKVFFPITHAKAVWFEKKNGVTVYDKIVELVSGLSNEISSRKNAVEDLSASMASEITGLRNSTSSQISNEASERKLADDTLAARMDTFTSLPSGSTSGDAELQDIRVGAGGEVYGSAGEAVRGQIGELKGDLTIRDVISNLDNNINLINKLSFTNGAYRHFRNAEIINFSSYSYSEKIHTKRGLIYECDSTTAHVCFFDVNGNYISGTVVNQTIDGVQYGSEFVAPDGAYSLCISMRTDTISSVQLHIKTTNKNKVVIVDIEGNGDYINVVEAVANEPENTVILVKPGVYDGTVQAFEKRIVLIGTDRNDCIIRSTNGGYNYPAINGSCGYFENLTILSEYVNGVSSEIPVTAETAAYAFHCENEYGVGKTLEFHHCTLKSDFFSALGIGVRKDFTLILDDCELINNQTTERGPNYLAEGSDGKGLGALFLHDSVGEQGDSFVKIKDTVFKSTLGYAMCLYNARGGNNKVYCEFINNTLYDEVSGLDNNLFKRGGTFEKVFVIKNISHGNTNEQLNS